MWRESLKRSRVAILLCCAIGSVLSAYALYVEIHAERDSSYKAMCDLGPSISCSKVFKSRYGKGFGLIGHLIGDDHPLNLPNSIFGLVFYCLQVILDSHPDLQKTWGSQKSSRSLEQQGLGMLGFQQITISPVSMIFMPPPPIGFSVSPSMSAAQLWMSALSNIASVYLAYILYFILNDFCLVCVSTYIVNAVLFGAVFLKHNAVIQRQFTIDTKRSK